MPLYDYRCKSCKELSVKFHSMVESPHFSCDCGGDLYRVILKCPQIGEVFKGQIVLGFDGGPRFISSKRELMSRAKESGQYVASKEELDQEANRNYNNAKNKVNNELVSELKDSIEREISRLDRGERTVDKE